MYSIICVEQTDDRKVLLVFVIRVCVRLLLYVEQIMDNFYTFKHRRVSKRSIESSSHYEQDLSHESKVSL